MMQYLQQKKRAVRILLISAISLGGNVTLGDLVSFDYSASPVMQTITVVSPDYSDVYGSEYINITTSGATLGYGSVHIRVGGRAGGYQLVYTDLSYNTCTGGGVLEESLSVGEVVGENTSFPGDLMSLSGYFTTVNDLYVGFRMEQSTDNYYYGWMRMSYEMEDHPATIISTAWVHEVAYNDDLNQGIYLGGDIVPEPSTILLFTMGVLLIRRVRPSIRM